MSKVELEGLAHRGVDNISICRAWASSSSSSCSNATTGKDGGERCKGGEGRGRGNVRGVSTRSIAPDAAGCAEGQGEERAGSEDISKGVGMEEAQPAMADRLFLDNGRLRFP